jgi:protein-disulfide isomerase
VLIEYSDFNCPYCRTFARDTLPEFHKKYVDTGKVRFVFRNLPLDQLHPFARQIARTTACADRQGKFWPLHDLIFAAPSRFDADELDRLVKQAGLDTKILAACTSSDGVRRVVADETSGRALGATGTPTFFLGLTQPDGKILLKLRMTGAQPFKQFESAVEKLLVDAGSQ